MFFLLRLAFWLGVVLILLPTGSPRQASATTDVGASDAISAASATVRDFRGFCTREPEACTVGSQVATEIGFRAQAGAKMLYEFLTEALAQHVARPTLSDGLRGTLADVEPETQPSQRSSQNTLTPADLAPAWRGPLAAKDARPAA